MRKRCLTLLCAVLCYGALHAQSAKLEQAINQYNALSDFAGKIRADSIAADQLDYVKMESDKVVALLDEVIATASGEQLTVAKYFKTNARFKYVYFWVLSSGSNAAMLELDALDEEMNSYNDSSFPLRYQLGGKNFIIKYENFGPTQSDYWLLQAEMVRKRKQYDKLLTYSRKAMASSHTGGYFRVVAAGFILESKEKKGEKDKETLDVARGLIRDFPKIEASQKEFLAKNKFYTASKAWTMLKEITPGLAGTPAQQGEVYADAAAHFAKMDERSLAAEAYQKAVQTGYSNTTFLYEVADFAVGSNNTMLGLLATGRLEQTIYESQCDVMQKTATYYRSFGNSSKADALQKRSEKCLKKQEKASRPVGSGFHLYMGGYVFPAFKKNYGGVVNFVFPKTILEFSYLNIRKKTENHMDLTTFREVDLDSDEERVWHGFYAHIAPKFVARNNWDDRGKLYTGFLLGYAQKEFNPMVSNVTRVSDGAISTETFNPTGKQYILLLNMGGLMAGRGLGFDMYASIGAAYNQFDGGHSAYDSDEYTIESAFLENRRPGYFTVVMRAGLTVGLCFGK